MWGLDVELIEPLLALEPLTTDLVDRLIAAAAVAPLQNDHLPTRDDVVALATSISYPISDALTP